MKVRDSDFLYELKFLEYSDFLALARALGVPIYNPVKKKIRDDFKEMGIEIVRAYRNLPNSKKRKIVNGLYNDRIGNLNIV